MCSRHSSSSLEMLGSIFCDTWCEPICFNFGARGYSISMLVGCKGCLMDCVPRANTDTTLIKNKCVGIWMLNVDEANEQDQSSSSITSLSRELFFLF